jgi:hypothetical protein
MGRHVYYYLSNISVLGSTDKEVRFAIDPCTDGPLGALELGHRNFNQRKLLKARSRVEYLLTTISMGPRRNLEKCPPRLPVRQCSIVKPNGLHILS